MFIACGISCCRSTSHFTTNRKLPYVSCSGNKLVYSVNNKPYPKFVHPYSLARIFTLCRFPTITSKKYKPLAKLLKSIDHEK